MRVEPLVADPRVEHEAVDEARGQIRTGGLGADVAIVHQLVKWSFGGLSKFHVK